MARAYGVRAPGPDAVGQSAPGTSASGRVRPTREATTAEGRDTTTLVAGEPSSYRRSMTSRRGTPVSIVLILAASLVACGGDDPPEDADAAGTTVEPSTSVAETTPVAPSDGVYDIDGRSVALGCEGRGTRTVVLLAGGIDPSSTWDGLVSDLGDDVLTCRFDAPGVGASDPPADPVTPARRAAALAAVLDAAGVPGPYVLVGHSLGGLTVRQFGIDHPDLLAGAVLLDPTTRTALLSVGPDLVDAGWDMAATQAQVEAAGVWPPVPLTVLSHDPARLDLGSEAVEDLWTAGQVEYTALTPNASQEVVAGAGHYIHEDARPRVVEAIEAQLAALDAGDG